MAAIATTVSRLIRRLIIEKLPQRFPCGCTGASLSPSDHLIASNIMICTFRMSHASVL